MPKPVANRLSERWVVLPSGCWQFVGHHTASGYGRIRDRGETGFKLAHRVAYETYVRKLEKWERLIRVCNTPGCIRPECHVVRGKPPQATVAQVMEMISKMPKLPETDEPDIQPFL